MAFRNVCCTQLLSSFNVVFIIIIAYLFISFVAILFLEGFLFFSMCFARCRYYLANFLSLFRGFCFIWCRRCRSRRYRLCDAVADVAVIVVVFTVVDGMNRAYSEEGKYV